MPRQTITLNGFEAGLANDPSRVDLNDNELYQAQDVDLDKHGIVRVLSRYDIVTSPDWASKISVVKTIEPGYGLYSFSADYDVSGNANATDYIAVAGKTTTNNKVVQIFDTSGNVLPTTAGSSSVTIATSDTSPFYPNFYYVDGALRICDGNLNSTKSSNYKLMYIKETIFQGSTHESSVATWSYFQNTYDPPTTGLVGKYMNFSLTTASSTNVIGISSSLFGLVSSSQIAGNIVVTTISGSTSLYARSILSKASSSTLSVESATSTYQAFGYIFSSQGNINLYVLPYSSTSTYGDGTFAEGNYNFGLSYVYEDDQESTVKTLTGSISASSGTAPYAFYVEAHLHKPYNNRIIGSNIYCKQTTGDVSDWTHVAYIRMRDGIVLNSDASSPVGVRAGFSAGYITGSNTVVGTTATDSNAYLSIARVVFTGDGETYRSISGFAPNTSDTTARYKTVAISNRSAYIGNVKINDKMLNDSILKSKPGKFDQFTEDNRLDVVLSDGDEIVRLESFEDRILQFKKRKLYIINTAQNIEFLEGTHEFKGLESPYHVVRTEYGIVWFNTFGCYLYDGKSIVDLLMDFSDQRRRKISLSEWQDFLGSNPSITYDRRARKVNIINKSSGTGQINIYSFDLSGFRWVTGIQKLGSTSTNKSLTNFVTDSDFSSVCIDGASLDMYKWSTATNGSSTALTFETKSINFELPGIDKIIYQVYIKHINSDGLVRVKYKTNGTSDLYSFSTSYLPDSTTYTTTRLVPLNSSQSHNWNSISIFIDSTAAPYDFELDNIELIYRIKGLR